MWLYSDLFQALGSELWAKAITKEDTAKSIWRIQVYPVCGTNVTHNTFAVNMYVRSVCLVSRYADG